MVSETGGDVPGLTDKKMKEWQRDRAKVGKAEPDPAATIIELTDANFDKTLAEQKLMLVDFWAPWCGPCRWVSPILEEIAKDNAGKLVLGKMNVDENPRTPNRFEIEGIPTILVSKNGTIAERIVGAAPKEMLMAKIMPHLLG